MKLREHDNWGHLTYTIGNNPFAEKDKFVIIHLADCVKTYDVLWTPRTEKVADHGNVYDVESKVPRITISYHGLEIVIDLMCFDKFEMETMK
jgi:hypothetical protein